MKVNPIGQPIPLEDFSFILLGLVPMDMRESFVCKYQAELIAFLEAELQPAFEAFKLSEAWQGFIPAAAGQSTQDEDLVQVLSKEADSAKDASLPNQAAGETAELQASDSFADYEPAKLDYGPPHVEHVVESASLACVAPVDITWKLSLPADLLASGALSRVQLEAVVYAVQQHEKILPTGARAGFFIGDGTGVGKGREGAAIILENFIRGRTRAVWFTCNTDLAVDAKRDLRDIGAGEIPLLSLSSAGYGKIEDLFDEGVLLVTYSCLVASSAGKGTRYEQLVEWLGERFDGVFLFDEAHKAKGAAMDQPVGRAVVGLQQAFLRARVVYLSATGATQVSDMSYMTRLGLWGAGTHFTNFKEFAAVLSSSSANGGMEMLAVQLKSSGAYLARSLGLRGVDFHLEVATLSDAQRRVYDQTASLWLYIHEEVALLHSRGLFRSVGGVLASAQTKCFQQVLLSFKVDEIQRQVRRALRAGKCAVIGLQSTGETAVKRAMGSGTDATLERLVSPAAEAIEIMIDTIERACDRSTSVWSSSSVSTFRQGVLSRLANIDLPPSAIDALIDYFGANVAEMTGRAKRLLRKADGSGYRLVTRSERGVPVSGINLLERQRFQSGEKLIAILSDAGATGVSLHADTNEGSQRRRVHIVPEIGFCASKIVQQFGRTHRTNQLMPPEYVLLMCESAGEALTGSAVARKLEGLGALTKGDKMAGQGETGGLGVNLETRSGQRALTDFMLMLNAGAQQDLSDKVRLHVAGAVDVKHLLTRLQLVPFKAQLQLLRAFTRKIKSNESATASQLAATSVVVTKESVIFKSRRNASETVTLKEIEVDHACPWEDALALAGDQQGYRGFYMLRNNTANELFVLTPIDGLRGRICLPGRRCGTTIPFASVASTCVRIDTSVEGHLALLNKIWDENIQTARATGAHLERFGLLNGSVFTIWPSLREALDPKYDPDNEITWHRPSAKHARQKGDIFEANIKIQLLTTSAGEHLGGVRISLTKPKRHAPEAKWAEFCNKRISHPNKAHCRKANCMEDWLSEAEKLTESIRRI